MPEIEFTGPILIEEDGELRTLTADDIRGPAGEEEMYSERTDFITETTLYRGWAAPGADEADPVWRIAYMVIGADNDISKQWANGSAEFNQKWTDRSVLTYN